MPYYYYLGPWVWDDSDPEQQPFYRAPTGTIGLVDLRPVSPTLSYGFFATNQEIVDSSYESFGDGVNRLEDIVLDGAAKTRWSGALGIGSIAGDHLMDALWETLTLYGDPEGGVICPPLMPTHLGVLELHLGGHSLIKAEKFTGPNHPAWPRIQALVQRNYRKARQEAHKHYKGNREPDLHSKYLECMRRKLRCPWEQLIPADLPRERPVKPTTLISDDFNRADSTNMGADWTEVNGDWSISNNTAICSANNGGMRHNTALSSDDHYSQLVPNINGPGPITRFSSSDYSGYYWRTYDGTDGGIYKVVAGTPTELSSTTSGTDGNTEKLESNGSSHEAFDNGVSAGSVTDTAITGNTQCGCFIYYVSNRTVDDFQAEDLVASGLSIPIAMHHLRQQGIA